jgi:hypothetical protein
MDRHGRRWGVRSARVDASRPKINGKATAAVTASGSVDG